MAVSKISTAGFMAHLWVSEVGYVYYTTKYNIVLVVTSDGTVEKHTLRLISFWVVTEATGTATAAHCLERTAGV